MDKISKDERDKDEKEYKSKKEKIAKILNDNIEYSEEEIEDYFLDLIDNGFKIDVIPICVKDGMAYYKRRSLYFCCTLDAIDEKLENESIYYLITILSKSELSESDIKLAEDDINMIKSNFNTIEISHNYFTRNSIITIFGRYHNNTNLYFLIKQK